MAGSLNFIQALPAGRPFLCSLYWLTHNHSGQKLKNGNHKHIPRETYLDMMMFKSFIQANAHLKVQTVPFLQCLSIDNEHIKLFTDATGAADKGIICRYQNQWFHGAWSKTSLFNDGYKPNIALLELLAIIIAFDIWALELNSKTITLQSGNQASCCFINRKKLIYPPPWS